VTNLKIEDPIGVPFPKHTQIELSLEMNVDKVLTIHAKCSGLECLVKTENPFSNTYETDEEKTIREKERDTYISADKNNGRPSRASLEALRKAYLDADKQYQAAETIEQQLKYYPEDDLYNYIGVLYHNSGNYNKSIRFFEKALSCKKNVWALSNLGHDLYIVGRNDEAKDYLEQALEMRPEHTSALSKLGDIYRDLGNEEKAHGYYEQCFNILNRKWKEGTLDDVDSTWFEGVAYKLGKDTLAREIAASRNQKKKHVAFNSENLLTVERNKEEE
jgi:tetratricopeptide (TPR) repeat protein